MKLKKLDIGYKLTSKKGEIFPFCDTCNSALGVNKNQEFYLCPANKILFCSKCDKKAWFCNLEEEHEHYFIKEMEVENGS